MIRVLAVSADGNEACSFYRGAGPLSQLMKDNGNIEVWFINQPTFGEIRASNVVFLLRPANQAQLAIFEMAKNYNVPVWVDYDDDLFSITTDNPNYNFYAMPKVQENMHRMIEGADLVTVSTAHLKGVFGNQNQVDRPFSKNVKYVPNALDTSLVSLRSNLPKNKMVMWRGTRTHDRDVDPVCSEIVSVAGRYPDWMFAFIGADPCCWKLREKIKTGIRIPGMELHTYWRALCKLKPSVIIAPLADTPFNRAKSNIVAIEAALAGAACIGPHWSEWMLPGVLNYDTPEEFGRQLEQLLSDGKRLDELAGQLKDYVFSELLLNRTNERRLELVENLMRGGDK